MKKNFYRSALLLAMVFGSFFAARAQQQSCNLLTNGDFEDYTQCPTNLSQIPYCVGWHDANVVTGSVIYPSADYYNCSFSSVPGYPSAAPPPSGTGFIGFNPGGTYGPGNGGEMVGTFVKLCQGVTYTFSFYSMACFDYVPGGTQPMYLMGINTNSWPAPVTGVSCPSNMTQLLMIPKSDVMNTSWTQRTYTFTSPGNFNAIIFGGVCGVNENYYAYFDDLVLTRVIDSVGITSNSVIPCVGGDAVITLHLPQDCYAPYDCVYTINGVSDTIHNAVDGDSFNVYVSDTMTVTLTGIIDDSCMIPVNSQVHFTTPIANASWTPPPPLCQSGAPIDLNALVSGSGQLGGTWIGGGVSGHMFSPEFGTQAVTYYVVHDTCSDTVTHTITVIPTYKDTTYAQICEGETFNFAGQQYNSAGIYTYHGTYKNGCDSLSTLNLTVSPMPNLNVSVVGDYTDGQLCMGESVTLAASGAPSYIWRTPSGKFLGSADTVNVILNAVKEQVWTVANNGSGCIDSTLTILSAKKCCELFVPNAFSPNGDGINDGFKPETNGNFRRYQIRIFDRYGQLVFESQKMSDAWDGKYDNGEPAAVGVYFYYITADCYSGTTVKRRGDVTLVR